jgi:hypothetical protein
VPAGTAGVAVQLTQEQQQHAFGGLGVARPLRRTSAAGGSIMRKGSSPGMPSSLIPSPAAVAPGTALGLFPTGSLSLQGQPSGTLGHLNAGVGTAGGASGGGGSQTDSPAAAVTLGTQYQTLATYGSGPAAAKASSLLPAPPPIAVPVSFTPGIGTGGATSASAVSGFQPTRLASASGAGAPSPAHMFSPVTSGAGAAAAAAGGSASGAWDAQAQAYSSSSGRPWTMQQQQQQIFQPGVPAAAPAAVSSFVMPDEHTLGAYAAAGPPLNFEEARKSPHGRPACCFAVLGVGGRCVLLQPSLHSGRW